MFAGNENKVLKDQVYVEKRALDLTNRSEGIRDINAKKYET